MISITVKGIKTFSADLEKFRKNAEKSLETAVKVEGFRLTKLLKKEIRAGAPGGSALKPLSAIASKRKRSKKILNKLALGVRYDVTKKPDLAFKFGWVGPKVSKSWKRISQKQQDGFKQQISNKQRRYFRFVGGSQKGRGKKTANVARVFFLRPETTMFKTPARPIMDPFWRANESAAVRNIKRNWARKMAGKRI